MTWFCLHWLQTFLLMPLDLPRLTSLGSIYCDWHKTWIWLIAEKANNQPTNKHFHQSIQEVSGWQFSHSVFLACDRRFCFWLYSYVCVLICRVVAECGTHAGMLLKFVQEVLSRYKKVQKVTKTVMLIGWLKDWEDLDKQKETHTQKIK